jgi:hypothetical protein
MGLSLEVGILASLDASEADVAQEYRDEFAELSRLLRARHLGGHDEPTECATWSADMFGYSGLHYLRRFAAHVDATGELPEPGDDTSEQDELLRDYGLRALQPPPSFLSRLFGSGMQAPNSHRFDHLILHSDAEGYYLPVEFDRVLLVPRRYGIPGGFVGSSQRLLSECEDLAELLEVPPELTSDSEELWHAAEHHGTGEHRWQRYGMETYHCVVLAEACRASIDTGAALVFT